MSLFFVFHFVCIYIPYANRIQQLKTKLKQIAEIERKIAAGSVKVTTEHYEVRALLQFFSTFSASFWLRSFEIHTRHEIILNVFAVTESQEKKRFSRRTSNTRKNSSLYKLLMYYTKLLATTCSVLVRHERDVC